MDKIETEEEYIRLLAEIGRLVEIDPELGTSDAERLDAIGARVEAYEEENYPMPAPEPIAAIRFWLEQQGTDAHALVGVIGTRACVEEVLSRRRALTPEMIDRLCAMGIPRVILRAA